MRNDTLRRGIPALTAVLVVVTAALAAAYGQTKAAWMLTAAISFGTTGYHFLMRLLVGGAVRAIFRDRFLWERKWFRPRKWEAGFYRFLRVCRWKDKMPTYRPEEFAVSGNSLEAVTQAGCIAELGHEMILLFSFAPLLTIPAFGAAGVFWSTSLLAALVDSVFVIMQRYNRPRFLRVLEKERGRHG